MAENQCIAVDYWEGHFRLSDPTLFHPIDSHSPGSQTESTKVLDTRPTPFSDISGRAFTEGRPQLAINKTVFKRTRGGNEFYKDKYDVYHNSKKFGVALANPRNKATTAPDDLYLQINNNKFYESGWNESLQEIAQNIEGKFHNFTRIDIAVDGAHPFEAYKRFQRDELILVGRANVNDYYRRKGRERIMSGFYIGMSKSKKRIKCYNKSAELDKSNKKYIERFWKLNNIDTSSPVERFELTLRNDEIKKYPAIDWTQLAVPSHLASIMKSGIEKFGQFRIPGHGKNISRYEEHHIINFEQLQGTGLEKDSTRPTTEIARAKTTCKMLFEIYHNTRAREYFSIAHEIAINAELTDWFSKMQPQWIEDFDNRGNKEGGDLTKLPWKYHYKRYRDGEQLIMHAA